MEIYGAVVKAEGWNADEPVCGERKLKQGFLILGSFGEIFLSFERVPMLLVFAAE